MVKLLKQSSISLHFENYKGSTGEDYKGTTNANLDQRHSNHIKPDQNERQYLSETERWPNVWRAGGWPLEMDTGLKRSERRSQDGGSSSCNLGYDSTKESEEMQIEGVEKRLTEGAEMWREYHFRSRRRTTPHLCDFVPLTKQGIYRRKTLGDKRKCGDARNFLKQCKKGASR